MSIRNFVIGAAVAALSAVLFAGGVVIAGDRPAAPESTPHGHGEHSEHGAGKAAGDTHQQPADGRQKIHVSTGERDFILHEMRAFLVSVEGIVTALAAGKPAEVAGPAKSSGMGATHDVPRELMRKLPTEWRTLGMDTHRRFDALALEATGMGDDKKIMEQLSGILGNCTGCHAAYRLVAE